MNRIVLLTAAFFAILAWLGVSWPALQSLHTRWIDLGDSYVLGYPLMAAAAWWGYMHRERLRQISLAPSWWGLILFALTLLVTLAGRLVQLQIVQQLMVPASLWFAVATVFGWGIARAAVLPIALQYFGMPVWDFLIDVLRTLTVIVTQTLLGWVHVPALIENNHIQLQAGIVTVADSCSGLNLLLAALLTGILQAEVALRSTCRRVLLIGVAAILGLLVNWIRVFSLVMIAHLSNMQNPLVYSHASFGWWIYTASLIPFFVIARRLEHGESREPISLPKWRGVYPGRGVVLALALLLLVTIGQLGVAGLMHRVGSAHAGFSAPAHAETIVPTFLPEYAGYDVEQAWQLMDSGVTYELLALTYLRQEKEKKLIFYRNVIAGADNLHSVTRLSTSQGVPVNFAIVGGREWHLVWWYYWVDGSITASPMQAKLMQLKDMLFGDPSAALVTLSRTCVLAGCEAELKSINDDGGQVLTQATQIRLAR